MTVHLKSRTDGMTACGIAAPAVGPTLWFATPKADRCPVCAMVEVEGQCLVIATVELKIVADTRKQLADEITELAYNPRVYTGGWVESYYHTNRPGPSGRKTLEAIEAVAENLTNLGTNEPDNSRESSQA